MTRFVLVRHGHVEGIHPERFRGRRDVPLSDLGRRQAEATGKRVREGWSFAEVYCSPLGRCLETARAIAGASGRPVIPLEGLSDIDYGAWEWLTFEEARARSPDLYQEWMDAPDLVRFPGGESLQDVQARTAEALRDLCARHPDATVVLVSHDSVNRVILLQLLGLPLSAYWRLVQTPCGINELLIDGERVRILRVNESAHVERLQP